MCVPLRCADALATGKESRSGRIALDRGWRGVQSPPSTDSPLQCVSCPPEGLSWGWQYRFFPSPTALIHFSLPFTLNIGGDSKNSLTQQNRERMFPPHTKGWSGTLVPLYPASREAIFNAEMASKTHAWVAMSVSAWPGVLYLQLQPWAFMSCSAFLCLSFPPPSIIIIMLTHFIMF